MKCLSCGDEHMQSGRAISSSGFLSCPKCGHARAEMRDDNGDLKKRSDAFLADETDTKSKGRRASRQQDT